MKLIKLSDLFEIKYGINLELNAMTLDKKGIPFVSCTSQNNGVSAYVKIIDNIYPNSSNTISFSANGSVCEAFLQKKPYYSGRDLFFLKPKIKLSDEQMLIYCVYLKANKYKYSYGRKANKTLKNLLVPDLDEINKKIPHYNIEAPSFKSYNSRKLNLNNQKWKFFNIQDIIVKLERGKESTSDLTKGNIPLISSSKKNNGVNKFVDKGKKLFNPSITVANGGSVGSAFYQTSPFYALPNVTVLKIKNLNVYIALFIITIIEKEKYRFNYGRQWNNEKMKKSLIKLPIDTKGKPDWLFMENYIKSLPYSFNLK